MYIHSAAYFQLRLFSSCAPDLRLSTQGNVLVAWVSWNAEDPIITVQAQGNVLGVWELMEDPIVAEQGKCDGCLGTNGRLKTRYIMTEQTQGNVLDAWVIMT